MMWSICLMFLGMRTTTCKALPMLVFAMLSHLPMASMWSVCGCSFLYHSYKHFWVYVLGLLTLLCFVQEDFQNAMTHEWQSRVGSFRQTLNDCTGSDALFYIGALSEGPEAAELLQFHSELLTAQLAAISQVDAYQKGWPWKSVAIFDASAEAEVLREMKQAWAFCTEYVDTLPATHKLFDFFGFTRYQSFRDCMVKGE